MKTDFWEKEQIENNIAEILRAKLAGLISDSEINEVIQNCNSDMALMEKYLSKYLLQIDIDEPFNIDEFSAIINEKFEVDDAYRILKYLSVFEHIGFQNHKEYQFQKVNNSIIKIDYSLSREIVEFLIRKKYISSQGHFIWLEKNKPHFFESFLKTVEDQEINELVDSLEDSETFAAFGRNIVNLSSKVSTLQLLEKFTNENGLFRNFEFLNTEIGSNLVLHFSETESRKAILQALNIVFEAKSIPELKNGFGPGRRNIVWGLEKLCYFKDTAEEASLLIYKLALAENEEIGNNSTRQFVQLFQPRLAETILSLESRFQILLHLEEKFALSPLLLSCYEKGLQTDRYYGNITSWGSKEGFFERYEPNYEELRLYYVQILHKLLEIYVGADMPFQELAKNIIIKRFYEQYSYSASDQALEALNIIIFEERGIGIKVSQLLETIIFEKRNLSTEKIDVLRKVLDAHKPSKVDDLLLIKVINAPYRNEKLVSGAWQDFSEEEAKNLAQEFIETDNREWLNHLDLLLKGEQRQTYSFGRVIGEKFQNTQALLDLCTEAILKIPPELLNGALIAGIVDGRKDNGYTRLFIDNFISHAETELVGIRLTRLIKADLRFNDIEKLFPLFEKNSNFLLGLQYLDISNLSDNEIRATINYFKKVSSQGYSFSIELLWDLFRKEEERWVNLKQFTRDLLTVEGILQLESNFSSVLHVEDLIKKLSHDDISDNEIKFFIGEILSSYEEFFASNETICNILIHHFLNHHFKESWPTIGEALLNPEYRGSYSLKNALKYFEFENEKILTWVEDNLPKAPSVLMEFIPFEVKNEKDKIVWSTLALDLIDKYGNDDDLLSSLATRLHNYFVSGSAVELYKSRKKLIEFLLKKDQSKVKIFAEHQLELVNLRIKEQEDFDSNYNLGEI